MDLAYLKLFFAGPTGAPAAAAELQQTAASMTPAPSGPLDTGVILGNTGWQPPLDSGNVGGQTDSSGGVLGSVAAVPSWLWLAGLGAGALLLTKVLK